MAGDGGAQEGVVPRVFAGLFGALLGLALLKFGNPVVLEKQIVWPRELLEWIIEFKLAGGEWDIGLLAGVLALVGVSVCAMGE